MVINSVIAALMHTLPWLFVVDNCFPLCAGYLMFCPSLAPNLSSYSVNASACFLKPLEPSFAALQITPLYYRLKACPVG